MRISYLKEKHMKNKCLKFTLAALLCTSGIGALAACSQTKYDATITFWHTFGKGPTDSIEAQAKKFTKLVKENEGLNIQIKFVYKGAYTDVLSNVTKSFASGETPTIAVAYPDHVADYFAAETTPGQYIVNLDKFINDPVVGFGKESYLGDKHGADDFVEAFLAEGQNYSREGTYSLPYMKSSEIMFYNKNAVRAFIQDYDSDVQTDEDIENFMNNITWDELMEFCEVIKSVNDSEHRFPSLEVPCFYDSDGNFIVSKMFQEEIAYSSLTENGSGRIDFNGYATGSFTPDADQITNYNKVVELLKEYNGLYNDGLFTTKGIFGEYGSNNFTQQKTVFSIGSSGGAGYNFPSTSTFEVGICTVPASNNNPLYVTQGPTLTMFNSAKLSKEDNDKTTLYAWKFLKFITNEDTNSDLCINGSEGYIPVRESAYSTQTFLDFMEHGEKYAKTADTVIHGIDGRYLNTTVFKGSATLRTEMAGCFADVMRLSNPTDEQIKTILNRAISNTVQKM